MNHRYLKISILHKLSLAMLFSLFGPHAVAQDQVRGLPSGLFGPTPLRGLTNEVLLPSPWRSDDVLVLKHGIPSSSKYKLGPVGVLSPDLYNHSKFYDHNGTLEIAIGEMDFDGVSTKVGLPKSTAPTLVVKAHGSVGELWAVGSAFESGLETAKAAKIMADKYGVPIREVTIALSSCHSASNSKDFIRGLRRGYREMGIKDFTPLPYVNAHTGPTGFHRSPFRPGSAKKDWTHTLPNSAPTPRSMRGMKAFGVASDVVDSVNGLGDLVNGDDPFKKMIEEATISERFQIETSKLPINAPKIPGTHIVSTDGSIQFRPDRPMYMSVLAARAWGNILNTVGMKTGPGHWTRVIPEKYYNNKSKVYHPVTPIFH